MSIKRIISFILTAMLLWSIAFPALALVKSQNPLIDPQTVAYVETKDELLNVLLLGIEKGFGEYHQSNWEKKPTLRECHTDVVMMLVINKTQKRIDLLSIPRDTLVYVPGVYGIYKVNAAFNLADTDEAGFEKVKETVSWLLGGVKIDAYCAVDMLGLVTLTDAMGGVDFYVDMTYTGSSETRYYPGTQHLNGMGVMDYVRARTNATVDNDDLGRNRRGRAMITTFIQRLRDDLDTVKALWDITQTNKDITFLTDLTLNDVLTIWNAIQTYDSKIGSYGLTGYYGDGGLDWYFNFTDQAARQSTLKTVYGIDAEPLPYVSRKYTLWMQNNGGFKTSHNLRVTQRVLSFAQTYENPTEAMKENLSRLEAAYNATVEAFDRAADTLEENDRLRMMNIRTEMETLTELVAKQFHYPDAVNWVRAQEWDKDPLINDYYELNWR